MQNAYSFDMKEYIVNDISDSHELLALTLNETSTGIMCSRKNF